MKFALIPVVAVAALVSGVTLAGVQPTGYDDYQTSGDTPGTVTSFNGPGKWTVLKAAPVPGKRYCVSGGATMYTPSAASPQTHYVFQGDELCIASSVLWPLTTAKKNTLDVHIVVSNLVLRNSGAITYGAKRPGIEGRCTLLDTSDVGGNRAKLTGGMAINKRAWVTDHAFDLVGDKNQCLLMEFTGANKTAQAADYAITGSQTNYFGMYRLGNGTSLCLIGDVPGNVVVESNALYRTWFHHGDGSDSYTQYDVTQDAQTISNMTLATGAELEVSATNVLTVVNLTLKGGSTIRLDSTSTTNGILVVAGKLTVTDLNKGKIKLICNHDWNRNTGTPPAHPTVVLGKDATVEGGTFGSDIFEFVDGGSVVSEYGLPTIYQAVRTAEDGTQTFVSTRKEVVMLVKGDSSTALDVSPLATATNAAGVAYWSDGKAPEAGKDYLAKDIGFNFVKGNTLFPFAGDSLTVVNLTMCLDHINTCAGASFKSFRMLNGSKIQQWGGLAVSSSTYGLSCMTIQAEELVLDGTVTGTPFGNRLQRYAAPLTGSGNLMLSTVNSTSKAQDGRANYELTGNNTNWTGKLTVSVATCTKSRGETGAEAEYWGTTVPSNRVFITLYVNDGKNLGGPLPTLTRDGITVEQYSMLKVQNNDVTYEQANRGITVNTIGQFSVASGKTFAIKAPLTLTGELWKQGDGVLALGGDLAFAGGASEVPAGGTNVVRVKSGALKALAKDAFNGADIRIESAGAGFRFDVNPTDAELATYGLCDVKTGGAISGAAVPVAFDGVTGPIAHGTKLGLFTLATEEAATALKAKLTFSPLAYNTVSTVVEQTALGYTVSAVFALKPGMMLMFR